jgi:hypothetical protein
VPKGADDVRIRRRSARIVMDETTRATLSVKIVVRGQTNETPFATMNRSALYLTRERGDWKVFGYEVDQQPFKTKKASDKDDKAKEKRSKSPAKDKKKDRKESRKKDRKESQKKRSGGGNQRGDRS